MAGMEGDLLLEAHARPMEEVLRGFSADPARGLTSEEAKARLDRYGPNSLAEEKKRPWIHMLMGQFKSPIVLLLVVAAALSFLFKEWLDGIAILAVLVINSLVGFFMEFQADRAMRTLKMLASVSARVLRDGRLVEIDLSAIVPGDVIHVEAGDMIPADARCIETVQAQANESALTGESVPVEKCVDTVPQDAMLAERTSMLYKATFITRGHARAVVVATGMNTELGRIATLVQEADQAATPLERRLEQFSRKLIKLTAVLVVIIFLAGLLEGQPWFEMLETAIALAVAAIPEGLPIVATMALAQGMLRMARHKVVVKRLSAVETLGSTGVICTDKTGTLTENRMEVVRVITPADTYDLAGTSPVPDAPDLGMVRAIAIHCSTATREIGDPLEVGLLRFALSPHDDLRALREREPKLREEPFSAETRMMSTQHRAGRGVIVYSKGAVEEILPRCDAQLSNSGERMLSADDREQWLAKAETMAISGLRVTAMAYRHDEDASGPLSQRLAFAGLVGMMDPPRPEVGSAITECRKAGIRVMMITGDHPATARNIAEGLGILSPGQGSVVNGRDLPPMDGLTAGQREHIAQATVFARVSPAQKLDLVKLMQEYGHVVAMTGDGLNDAPALKKADIGIAMGVRGTQVSQEVADIVLQDDQFTSIVRAVKQGRTIFDNIRNVVVYLLSCNLSELFVIAVAAVMGLHFQLQPLQILFINLVTDVLPALALGVIRADASIMRRPPRDPDEPIIGRRHWSRIITYALIIALASLGAVLYSHYALHAAEPWNHVLCNNILFFTLIAAQLLHALNMGAPGVPFFRTAVVRDLRVWGALALCAAIIFTIFWIPVVRTALGIEQLGRNDALAVGGLAFLSFLLIRLMNRSFLHRG